MAKIYATTNPKISLREKKNMERARKIACQSMVLLKNDGALPLEADGRSLALFGSGARRTVKGGTGSGDVNSRNVYNVEQGLKEAGFHITTEQWLDLYDTSCNAHLAAHTEHFLALVSEQGQKAILDALEHPYREPDVPEITEADLKDSSRDYAVYIIARTSGEGSDRRVAPGDYELSEGEKQNLQILTENFDSVIVVLNVGGVIDTEILRSNPKIRAILLMSQLGNISGLALADILTGKETPSGHLTTTWAKQYNDYPSADSFGHRNGDLADEYYYEDIFVGYRYFDSFGIKPAYPFGYGLSYTEFSIELHRVSISGGNVSVQVQVRNIGKKYSGRQSVQVYVSQPEGKLKKPYQILTGFAKTVELSPGQSETLTISFPVTDMASYDEEMAAWLLERGSYFVRVGTHSRATHIAAELWIEKDTVTEQLANKLTPVFPFKTLSPSPEQFYTYEKEAQEKTQTLRLEIDLSEIRKRTVTYSYTPVESTTQCSENITMGQVVQGNASLDDLTAQLTTEELILLCVGAARGGFGSTSVIGAASNACPGAAGDTTSALLESRGISNLVLADGPAGLRLSPSFVTDINNNVIPGLGESALGGVEQLFGIMPPERPEDAVDHYQYCTAIPVATALAQSWDMKVLEEAGDIAGSEMEEFGVALWLAPGMNIQRNPLCGRNFEYFSEDPFLSGMCAAADTSGVQKHPGCGTTIKHFALNNLEDNRAHNNSHCTERAIREIYLRGFRIAIQKSAPLALMTSYNLLNGLHTANHRELLTDILRDEWGYEGLVMTDWGTTGGNDMNPAMNSKYGVSDPVGCIQAGNDLIMPGSHEDVTALLSGVQDGKLSKAELQACAKRVLNLVLIRQKRRKNI